MTAIRTITNLFTAIFVFASISSAQKINTPNKPGPIGTQVNTLTGNLFIPRTDLLVPSRGMDLNISFYYNSFNFEKQLEFGNGWSFEYGIRYKKFGNDSVIITWGNGREDNYLVQGGGFKSPAGFFNTLNEYQPGKFLLTENDGTKYFFDNPVHQKVTKVQERNGNAITFTYTDTLLSSLATNTGQTITFVYTSGKLATVTDALTTPVRIWSYTYDNVGNLAKVTDPLGNSNNYTYLTNGPMKTASDKNNNTVDIIYYNNFMCSELVGCTRRVSFSYDEANYITIATDHIPDGTNQVTRYTYKPVGQRAWLTSISGNCCGFNSSFEFDANGNKIKETDGLGNTYNYTYDSKGNLLTATDPMGNVSAYTYSSTFNKLTSYTDPKGNVHSLAYDVNGNMIQLTEPGGLVFTASYNANGDLLTSTDPRGITFTYTYDAFGHPAMVTGPNGAKATFTYDARGNLLSKTDGRNNAYSAEYDLLNRVKKIIDPLNQQTQVTYDAEGNPVSYVNEHNELTRMNYDAANRLVKITDAMNTQSIFNYDAMDNVSRITNHFGQSADFTYDSRNRLTSFKDPDGNVSRLEYDANGNVISKSYPNGRTITRTFDNLGRIVSQQDEKGLIGSVTYDANDNITSYTNASGATTMVTYDALDRVKTITDALGNTEKYTYDNNDNIISYTDKNGNITTYTYDSVDRVKNFTNNIGGQVTKTYDPKGNLLTLGDQNNNTTTYSYDGLDRIKSITYPDGKFEDYTYDTKGNVTAKRTASGSIIQYEYDTLNRLTRKTLPDGNVYTYVYNAIGRLVAAGNNSGTVTLGYDNAGRITSETFNNHTTQYTYNITGGIKTIIYPDGSSISKAFDTRGRLLNVSQNNTAIISYEYDNKGHITGRTYANGISNIDQFDIAGRQNVLQTGAILNNHFTFNKMAHKLSVAGQSTTEDYTYDGQYRLTAYKKMAGNNTIEDQTYIYDPAGNRISVTFNGTTFNYTKNNLNQLVTSSNGSQLINFAYDNNGNLTFDGLFYKRYDAEGRLLSDSASPGNKITYSYDAVGRRIKKSVNGIAVNYYYAGLSPIEQRDGNTDTLINKTVFSNFISPVMSERNTQKYYYHQNDLFSVEAITNSSGALVERYQYDPYGRTTIFDANGNLLSSSLAGNRFGFTAQEYDAETGSYHFHFRDYSPVTGVFNQRDPAGYADQMALYQYTGNNPANGIDLLGLKPCPPTEVQTFTDEFGHSNNWLGILNFLAQLQKDKALKNFGGALEKMGHLSIQSQVTNLILQINSLINDAPYITQRESNTRTAEIEANLMYLHGDLDAIRNPASELSQAHALATGTIGAIDGLAQELTGKSLARHYQDLDEPSIKLANRWLDQAKKRYEMDARHIETYKKIFGDDEEKWDQDFKDLVERHNKAAKQYKKTEIGTYRTGMDPDCPPSGNNGGILAPPPGPRRLPSLIGMEILHSFDPNEIIGPDGVNDRRWVSIKDRMAYTILFENDKSASAPAKRVRITTPVEPKQDASTFLLGDFGFNSLTFSVPTNTSSYYQRLNAIDSLGMYVDVTAGYDPVNSVAFWEFQSIDPVTLLPPADPLKGFLLLPDSLSPTYGHGFVNFSMKPASSSQTGDTISAHASIIFDQNDVIPTNYAKNTIDAVAPVSTINNTVAVIDPATVKISWSGMDDVGGSGVKSYSVYVSVNSAPFVLYRKDLADTTLIFYGSPGANYCFFTTAKDSTGNEEVLKNSCLLSVHMGPGALPVTLLFFTTVRRDNDALLSWATASEINSKYFVVERSLDGALFTSIGMVNASGFSSGIRNYEYLDRDINRLGVKVIYYRLKQVDIDNRFVYSRVNQLRLEDDLNAPIVNAYPNPFTNVLNLQVIPVSVRDKTNAVELYNVYGTLVYRKEIEKQGTTTVILNDMPALSSGVYILKTTVNGKPYTTKLVKN